ncbi:YD repeat-containing protein [Leeuwenhoekiella aestuarii]|uniref:hypothetical protein n=1 Tax=Leeuwenhoekiella aestuarii TaxID=2249426 RepID=UPI000FFE6C9F|nr:hypothetical protein [Leeuwenhoekiella aestuarii]RXG17134.1 YD repeat-containing protein [Leeuwenhoekiella aestuarii]
MEHKTLNMTGRFFLRYFIIFSVLPFQVLAQDPAPNQTFTPQEINIPKTPSASSLYEFSPYTVDHTSGSANIEIPIYTIKSGRITLPISISYQTSGIRVQDLSSMIGLGWNLNYGYRINISKEETKVFPYSTKLYKNELDALAATNRGVSWMEEMTNSADGFYPSMHPIYNFNCGSFSGSFFYDDNGVLQLLSKDDDLKIETINNSVDAGFKITTPDAMEYIFDKKETSLRTTQTYPGPTTETTAFCVSKIIDLVTGRKIEFEYVNKPYYFDYSNETYTRSYKTVFNNGSGWNPPNSHQKTPFKVYGLQIKYIHFDGGRVFFNGVTDRLDRDKTRISYISIYSLQLPHLRVKDIVFNQSYFTSYGGVTSEDNNRLKLNSVTFKNSSAENTYSFQYNPIGLPPYRKVVNGYTEGNNTSIDYWGFYNNSGGAGLIPTDIHTNFTSQSSVQSTNRKANPQYTQACLLNKITYPTGGFASFEYENHKLSGYYLGGILGGLRVKKIKYFAFEDDLQPIEKTYNYLSVKSMTPASLSMFTYQKYKGYVNQNQYGNYSSYMHKPTFISSQPLYPIVYHRGAPVFYDKVEEIEGNLTQNSGKTLYTYNFASTYMNEYDNSQFKEDGYNRFTLNQPWKRGQLLSKEVFKNNFNSVNPYTLVSKEVYTYKGFSKGNRQVGFTVSKNGNSSGAIYDLIGPKADDLYYNYAYNGNLPVNAFEYNDLVVSVIYSRIGKIEKFIYEDEKSLSTSTEYFYDSPNHEQLSRIEAIDSKGRLHATEYKYVQDESTIQDVSSQEQNNYFQKLRAINKLNDVIEESTFIEGDLVKRKRKRFVDRLIPALYTTVPLMLNSTVTNYKNNAAVGTEVVNFLNYDDSGKLLAKSNNDGAVESYIWDALSINLKAIVSNSIQGDVYQNSFEYGEKEWAPNNENNVLGSWQYSGEGSYDSTSPTGSQTYTLNSGKNLSVSNLNPNKKYVVSYWSSAGNYNVSGSISTKTGKSIGNWTYYEHLVSNVINLSISGAGKIDEVRLYPEGAQMISFAHTPMIGLSSKCDEKNNITYYKYDGLGRLISILDQYRKIIKRYSYKYYGEVESFNETY